MIVGRQDNQMYLYIHHLISNHSRRIVLLFSNKVCKYFFFENIKYYVWCRMGSKIQQRSRTRVQQRRNMYAKTCLLNRRYIIKRRVKKTPYTGRMFRNKRVLIEKNPSSKNEKIEMYHHHWILIIPIYTCIPP